MKSVSQSKPVHNAWLSPAEAEQRRAKATQALKSETESSVTQVATPSELSPSPEKASDEETGRHFLVDIGVNLAHKRFSHDLSEVVQRAIDAQVKAMVVTGTSIGASRRAVEVAKLAPGVLFTTAGVHPHDAKTWNHQSASAIRDLVARNRGIVKAIGECGLDYDRNFSTPEQQIIAFRAQLELACELQLPVFLHERSAFGEFIRILREYRPRLCGAVVHCFTGTEKELQEYLALDLHIGITGWVCDERRGQDLLRMSPCIPLERLMIETDAPFLTPRSIRVRDNRNEPCYLPIILQTLANERGCSASELMTATTSTALNFFRLQD